MEMLLIFHNIRKYTDFVKRYIQPTLLCIFSIINIYILCNILIVHVKKDVSSVT